MIMTIIPRISLLIIVFGRMMHSIQLLMELMFLLGPNMLTRPRSITVWVSRFLTMPGRAIIAASSLMARLAQGSRTPWYVMCLLMLDRSATGTTRV